MNGPEFQFACLSDQRLAAHALSPTPVWLWSTDATRVLWANPVAAAIFDAASPGALAALRFEPEHAAAAQVARLAGTLPQGGAPRLERLRGFGADYGARLVCLCSRIALADNSAAVLVVATERAGQGLALPDRAQRLLADLDRPAAVFTADGELIEAMPAARERFGDKRDLVALGAEQLAREASLNGRADGDIAAWPVTILRLGAGATMTLLVAFAASETGRPRHGAGGAHRPQSGCGGSATAAFSVPLRLADRCRQSLYPWHGRIRQSARSEDRRRARPPLGGHRRRAQARRARRRGECACRAQHLERHRRALAGR